MPGLIDKLRDKSGDEVKKNDASESGTPSARPKAGTKKGSNYDDAKKTERKEEGTTTYGAPMQGSAFDNQTTDSNN
jgi:ribosomal protein L12E/L44/L45/RPP1/RPP2